MMFAQISNKILYQSIGLQVNNKITEEVEIEIIDYDNESCKNCKNRILVKALSDSKDHPEYIRAANKCSNCPHRKTKNKKIIRNKYINEKNKYGYRPMLKRYAILILMHIHLNNPDSDGVIIEYSVNKASKELGCTERTVKNCLKSLEEYGYIIAGKVKTNSYNIIINDYREIYLRAHEGGRGYFVMSTEIFEQLCNIKSLVSLRIHVRELLSMGSSSVNGMATIENKKISEIQKYLPKYCKRNVILKEVCKYESELMKIEFKEESNSIRFELDKEFMQHTNKEKYVEYLEGYFNEYIMRFNSQVGNFNTGENVISEFESAFYNLNNQAVMVESKMLKTTTICIDLAYLTLEYGIELVKKGFFRFYSKYLIEARQYNNPGALIRTFINQIIKEDSEQAA